MHMDTWICVFLGFGPSTQNTVLRSSWSGPADSSPCTQTIRRFEKLAESVAEVVQRSNLRKRRLTARSSGLPL